MKAVYAIIDINKIRRKIMAKNCLNCDKKISIFSNDPFEFDDIILCYDCFEPISGNMNALYYTNSQIEFYELRDKIIRDSCNLYDEKIVETIDKKIEWIYNNTKSRFTDDSQQEYQKSKYNKKQKCDNTYNNACNNTNDVIHKEKSSNYDLYTDIGNKIKEWAKWIFVFESVISVVSGFVWLANDGYILVGLLLLFCGPVVAWVSTWTLYAFGELVDKTSKTEKHMQTIIDILSKGDK